MTEQLNWTDSQSYSFSSSHVWMWELDHKIGRVLKNLCFQTVVLEKTLESPLDSKEIKLVNPNGYQSWIFTGRTNAKAEVPILWQPDTKSRLIRKDPDAGKNWEQKKKEMTEDEMVGWHHWLNGHEFEQTPGVLQSMGSQRVRHNWATEQNWSLQSERLPFPGGTIATYPHSQCRGPDFDPWSGN